MVLFLNPSIAPQQYQGRKEMLYLMMHTRHFIYGYMLLNIIMVKDHSCSESGNMLLPLHGPLFSINYFICIIPQTGEHIPWPL